MVQYSQLRQQTTAIPSAMVYNGGDDSRTGLALNHTQVQLAWSAQISALVTHEPQTCDPQVDTQVSQNCTGSYYGVKCKTATPLDACDGARTWQTMRCFSRHLEVRYPTSNLSPLADVGQHCTTSSRPGRRTDTPASRRQDGLPPTTLEPQAIETSTHAGTKTQTEGHSVITTAAEGTRRLLPSSVALLGATMLVRVVAVAG